MTQKTSRKAALVISLATAGLLLGGCGATGQNAATSHIKQVTDGVEGNSGSIAARDVLVVAQSDGSAALVGTIVNDGQTTDYLTGITVNGIAAHLNQSKYELAQNAPVIFSGDSANATGVVPGLKATPGTREQATITFAHSDPINLNLLVLPKSGFYANVGSSEATTAPATIKAAATSTATTAKK